MIITTSEINRKATENAVLFAKSSDEAFAEQICSAAEKIRNRASDKPIILLSGPSGSGKTTTALMIEKVLDESGLETHTLSMDDWFIPLSEDEKNLQKTKKLNLESPDRVDSDFLSEQLTKIINCEEVELPKFDFTENSRKKSGRILKRKPGELVILEGIHALNPDVVKIDDDFSERIYVSVRTKVEADDGKIFLPQKIRLMRRMLRDLTFRNRPVENTAKMFDSVENGENKYIRPFKDRATLNIDTFIPYELCAYKTRLTEQLRLAPKNRIFDEITDFLNEISPIDDGVIPKSSLIREFIGNGQFEY